MNIPFPLTQARANEIIVTAPRDPFGGSMLAKAMSDEEEHIVRRWFADHAPGHWSFTSVVLQSAKRRFFRKA